MLLRELKNIFEVDRQPLETALGGLNIQTDRSGGTTGRTGGDVADNLRDVIETTIVTASPVQLQRSKIQQLTSSEKVYEVTEQSIKSLEANIDQLEGRFTGLAASMPELKEVAVSDGHSTTDRLIASIVQDLEQSSSRIRTTYLIDIENTFNQKRQDLLRAVMKKINTLAYVRSSVDHLETFLQSKGANGFLDATGTPTQAGLNAAKHVLEMYFAIIITMKLNAANLKAKIEAHRPT